MMTPIDLLWFLTVVGLINCEDKEGVVRLEVMNGSDVVLPCSLNNENIKPALFVWRKDGQQDVFLYDDGTHYNNGRLGQDEQFKGRVSHFPDELINGNASIIIRNTPPSDSGSYTCDFPYIQQQRFHIELLVGVSPTPIITLHERNYGVLLHCEVLGASPKPVVEWWDSDGNILPADQPTITDRGGNKYDVILNTTVTKTGFYHCVSTQKDINHQIYTETFLPGPGDDMEKILLGLIVGCCCLLLLLLVLYFLLWRRIIRRNMRAERHTCDKLCRMDGCPERRDREKDLPNDPEQPLNTEEDTEPGVAPVEPDGTVMVDRQESTE